MKLFKGLLVGVVLAMSTLVSPSYADETRILVVSATKDVGNLADGAGETLTITVPGAALGDSCLVSFGVDLQDMLAVCYVQAANAVEVRVQNETTGAINLASTTMRVFVFSKGTH